MVAGEQSLFEPTKAFDNCGYRKYTSETAYTDYQQSSTQTTTAVAFLKSVGV